MRVNAGIFTERVLYKSKLQDKLRILRCLIKALSPKGIKRSCPLSPYPIYGGSESFDPPYMGV
jgi:hypothetical protein